MAKTPSTKKSSASTEIVLGQASQQINKAVQELASATATITKLAQQSDDLSLQVSNKEEQIIALETQYKEKSRQADVDLEVSMKSNTEAVVTGYLNSVGKISVSKSDWNSLTKELADTKANSADEVKKAVAIVSNQLSTQYANDKRFAESEHKAVIADNASKIGVLQEKNAFLEQQVTKLYQQLDAERSASIERAKAGSVGSINVSSERK